MLTATILFGLLAAMPVMAGAETPPGTLFRVGPRGNNDADPANGIYVSPDGNDSGARGNIDSPFRSINAALAAADPGDTIILRGGTYREGVNVRVRKPNITIKSARGEWAVIDLTNYNSGHDEDSGVYFDVDSSGGRLKCVEVIGGYYAVCMETKWDWGDPNDRGGASNIVIEDCILHDSRDDVVKVKPNCDDVTIRYNEIFNSGREFIGHPGFERGDCNSEGIDNVNGDRMIVQNNYIHDICSNAIYAKGGAIDALIENNIIVRAYGAGIMVGFDTDPDYFDLTVNPRYYENIGGIVRNNLIMDTGWEGIGLYASKDAQIYNNTLVNVDNGGLYHSAIYFGLSFQAWEDGAGRPASVNPNIHHNIVSQPASFNRAMIEIRFANEDQLGEMPALEGNPVMGHNCYFIAGRSSSFGDRRPNSTLENAGLSAWQSHIGGDSGSIEVDPGFDANYLATNALCAGMGIFSDSPTAPTPSMSNFHVVKTYAQGQFSDVNEDEWYGWNRGKNVASAYEYELMSGTGNTTFEPEGVFTIAEAIGLASRVHSIYLSGQVISPIGVPWYMGYIEYAADNGIIRPGNFAQSDYERPASRAEMAYIFSRALPGTEFAQQNTVNSLPDVPEGTPYRDEIFMLYRAGVFRGSDEQGSFNPGNSITRAEVATIISFIILPDTRASGLTFE